MEVVSSLMEACELQQQLHGDATPGAFDPIHGYQYTKPVQKC